MLQLVSPLFLSVLSQHCLFHGCCPSSPLCHPEPRVPSGPHPHVRAHSCAKGHLQFVGGQTEAGISVVGESESFFRGFVLRALFFCADYASHDRMNGCWDIKMEAPFFSVHAVSRWHCDDTLSLLCFLCADHGLGGANLSPDVI